MDTRSKTKRRIEGAALIAAVLAFFSPALSKTFIFRDAINLFYPYKAVEAPYLSTLTALTWNPWETMGAPFVAELATSWFYPANILFMLVNTETAYRLFVTLHYLLAAWSMWSLLKSRGQRSVGAAVGTLGYTLSGYLLSAHGLPDMLATASWLPASVWLLSRYLLVRDLRLLILYGGALAMPLLAGRAEGVLILAMAGGAWILLTDDAGETLVGKIKTGAWFLPVALGLALVLSLVQFLPSLELGRLSMKGEGYPLEVATLWSLHPARLIELILPSPYGRFWPVQTYQGGIYSGWEGFYPFAVTEYMGLVALFGALYAAVREPKKKTLPILIAMMLALLFSMGQWGLVYEMAQKAFPFFRMFRYPEKYMALFVFAVCVAGGRGVSLFLSDWESGKRSFGFRSAAMAVLAALFLGVVVFLLASWLLPESDAPSLKNGKVLAADLPGNWLVLQLAHFGAVVAAVVLTLAFTGRKRARWAGASLAAISILDLSAANHWVIPYGDPSIFDFTPAAFEEIKKHSDREGLFLFGMDGLPKPGIFRVMRDVSNPPEHVMENLSGASRLERLRRWHRHTLQPNFNFPLRIEELTGYTAAMTADYGEVMSKHLSLDLMRLFNVRFVIGDAGNSLLRESRLPVVGSRFDLGFVVHELDRALPRAYLVGRSLRTPDQMERLDLVGAHDFSRAVLLDDDGRLPPLAEEADLAEWRAEIVSYSPEEVRIECESSSAAYLVLSDSFYPGWGAEVDGASRPVFLANYLARAVRVPEGRHQVVFTYRPRPYLYGVWVSGIGWGMAMTALLGLSIRKRVIGRKSEGVP